MTQDAFDLLHGYLNGTIGETDFARLQSLLRENADARRMLRDLSTVDAKLQELAAVNPATMRLLAAPAASPAQVTRRPVWFGWLSWRPLTAAAVVLLTLAVQYFMRPGERRLGGAGSPESIAMLLLAEDCQWQGAKVYVEGQRLTAQTLRLLRGTAVLRFAGGAEVVMSRETEIALESRGSVRLLGGRLTVRAPEEAAGFVVRTPASDVVDLGTEFAVSVERKGATEVHVLEGKVAYGKPGAPQEKGQLLEAGKAVRYNRSDAPTPSAVPLAAPRFSELFDAVATKPRDEDWLLAAEPFDYSPGRVPLDKATSGRGWAGAWRVRTETGVQPTDGGALDIAIGRLNQQWPVPVGRGLALRVGEGFGSRLRPMAKPIRLDRDGIYYMGIMVRQEPSSGTNTEPLHVWLGLRSSRALFGDRAVFRVGALGKRQIEVRNGESFVSPAALAREGAQYWVGKIIAREHGEDEIFFRVYEEGEPFDLVEPASWSVQTRGVFSDAQLDVAELGASGSGGCWIDELRLGKNWLAAVFTQKKSPPTPDKEPPSPR